jgi:hypothetical protein
MKSFNGHAKKGVEFNNMTNFGIMMEIQYFDTLEFSRRKNFSATTCCAEDGEHTNCQVPNSGLSKLFKQGNFNAQPTVGVFFGLQPIPFPTSSEYQTFVYIMILIPQPSNFFLTISLLIYLVYSCNFKKH